MANTANQEYRIPAGSAFLYAVRLLSVDTGADFLRADINSITEYVYDTVAETTATRTLTKTEVVFDSLQTSALIKNGQYSHNIRVLVPSTVIAAKRRYRYWLVVVPDDGQGAAVTSKTQKTEEIDIIGD